MTPEKETVAVIEETSENQEVVKAEVEQPQKELSAHEIKVLKGQRANWYKDQLTYLKPELEYHEMLAKIEQAKADTMKAQYQQASYYASINNIQNQNSAPKEAKEPSKPEVETTTTEQS